MRENRPSGSEECGFSPLHVPLRGGVLETWLFGMKDENSLRKCPPAIPPRLATSPPLIFGSRRCIWRPSCHNRAMNFLRIRKSPSLFAQLEMIESLHFTAGENNESSRLVIHFVSGKVEAIVGEAALEANDIILKRLAHIQKQEE